MFKLSRSHNTLGPFERRRALVIAGHKAINGLPQLRYGGEAGTLQGLAAQDAEPALDLIEPGSVRGRVVKTDVGVTSPPAVVLGLMATQVVHNHMQLPAGVGGHHAVHKIEKLPAPATMIMSGRDDPAEHLQSRKQRGGSTPLVFMIEASQDPAIGHPQPPSSALQALHPRFLVHAEDRRSGRRVPINPPPVRRFSRKFRIGPDTPPMPPLQFNAVLAQHPPHLGWAAITPT